MTNRKRIWGLIGIVAIATPICYVLLSPNLLKTKTTQTDTNEIEDNFITEFRYLDTTSLIEVRVDKETGITWLFIDKQKERILNPFPKQAKPILTLPQPTEPYNYLKERDPEDDLTWGLTIEESSQYLLYLKQEGYTPEMEVNTTTYIEYILTHPTQPRKRVIIFNNTLMEGEYDPTAPLPKVEEYLSKYDKQAIGGNTDE